MPAVISNAVFYIAAAPVIEIEDGMFRVTYCNGDWKLNVALPPRVFLKALRNANAIAGEYEDGMRDTVVPIRAVPDDVASDGHG